MWNFIRVEYKHIEICKEFKVTMNVELPFKKDKEGKFVLKDATILDFVKMNRRLEKMSTKYVDNVLSKDYFGDKNAESNFNLKEETSKAKLEQEFGKKLGNFIKHHQNLTKRVSEIRPLGNANETKEIARKNS